LEKRERSIRLIQENAMRVDRSLAGAVGVLALAGLLQPAHSAPLGNAAGHARPAIAGVAASEQIAYRLCETQGGVRRCRWVDTYGPRAYGYRAPPPVPGVVVLTPPVVFYYYRNGYRPNEPSDYPTGTTPWWRSMDYWDLGGVGGH
jgi:hypothetical protein